MKAIIIIVADSSRARFFTTDSPSSPLNEIEAMAHPEGKIHEQKLVSDLPGRDIGQGGAGGHAYQDEIDPKEQEVIYFAKRVADHLGDLHQANKHIHLLIVAAPAFLGELRKHMSKQTNERVAFELAKNLTQHSVADIRKHLPNYLTH